MSHTDIVLILGCHILRQTNGSLSGVDEADVAHILIFAYR